MTHDERSVLYRIIVTIIITFILKLYYYGPSTIETRFGRRFMKFLLLSRWIVLFDGYPIYDNRGKMVTSLASCLSGPLNLSVIAS